MEHARHFIQYAADFEKTYEDDDWSRLECYFTDDAVYAVTGEAPLGGEWSGREALLQHLHDIVDDLDRRFETRVVEMVGAPEVGENTIAFDWKGTYKNEGEPDLVFGGREEATYSEGRIVRLVDTMEEGADLRIQAWLEAHPAD